MPLSISALYPDIELKDSEFVQQLTNIAMQVKQLPPLNNSLTPTLEVKFMLSGHKDSPDFKGMRLRSFEAETSHLTVEAAIPLHINNSEQAFNYIIAALQDANENAGVFFAKNNIAFEQSSYMAAIDAIQAIARIETYQ